MKFNRKQRNSTGNNGTQQEKTKFNKKQRSSTGNNESQQKTMKLNRKGQKYENEIMNFWYEVTRLSVGNRFLRFGYQLGTKRLKTRQRPDWFTLWVRRKEPSIISFSIVLCEVSYVHNNFLHFQSCYRKLKYVSEFG